MLLSGFLPSQACLSLCQEVEVLASDLIATGPSPPEAPRKSRWTRERPSSCQSPWTVRLFLLRGVREGGSLVSGNLSQPPGSSRVFLHRRPDPCSWGDATGETSFWARAAPAGLGLRGAGGVVCTVLAAILALAFLLVSLGGLRPSAEDRCVSRYLIGRHHLGAL